MSAGTAPRDRGFTLIELLIAIFLLGVIATAVGASLFFGIKATSDTHSRIDQSLTEMGITRFLSGDIYAAEGPVLVKSASDTSCGGVAPLKFLSRSDVASATRDTAVVWALSGTDLVRRTCVNGTQVDSFVVAKGVSGFVPADCAAPCTSSTISVTFTAAANGSVKVNSWTLTLGRRGATS